MATRAAPKRKPPWKRAAPAKTRSHPLTASQKQVAKTRAAKAGRRYPNLIDNMMAARKKRAS